MGSTLNNLVQQIVETIEPGLDKVIVQDSEYPDKIVYICYAEIGTPQNAVGWRIQRAKCVSDEQPTKDTISFPFDEERQKFSALPDFICSMREDYAYSQDD